MEQQKGYAGTVLLIGAAVIAVAMIDRKWSGDEAPAVKPSPTSSPVRDPSLSMEIRARSEVRSRLRDPSSAEFSDIHVRLAPTPVVCGMVNSRNGFGGMTGPQRFVSGSVTALEEQMPAGEMKALWAKLGCS